MASRSIGDHPYTVRPGGHFNGPVHKSRGDSVVCAVEQVLYEVFLFRRGDSMVNAVCLCKYDLMKADLFVLCHMFQGQV